MALPSTTRRPFGVTLIAVLTWISGALGILGGVVLILAREDAGLHRELQVSSSTIVAIGVVYIVVGLITILVAGGLLRGSGFARGLVTLLMILQLLGGFYALLKLPGNVGSEWASIIVAVIVLLLLFSPQANAFFRRR